MSEPQRAGEVDAANEGQNDDEPMALDEVRDVPMEDAPESEGDAPKSDGDGPGNDGGSVTHCTPIHPQHLRKTMPRRAEAENVVRLTQGMLATLTLMPGKAERIIWDEEVRGFGIRLRASGARTWVIRPPRKGKGSNLHTLAPAAPSAGAIDLRSARQKANETLSELALGGDPFKTKCEAAAQPTVTLGSLVETYLADKLAKGRRASTVYGVKNHLNRHWAPLHDLPLSELNSSIGSTSHRALQLR